MVMFFSFIVTKLSRVNVLLEFETISSCWTWNGTDISFPFLSPNYQSHRVIRVGNNIELLNLVLQWFFCIFNLTEQ